MAFDINTAQPLQKEEVPEAAQPSVGFDISTAKPVRSDLTTAPIETLKRSAGEFFGGLFDAVAHPIETGKSIGALASGTIQKLIPGEQPNEKIVDSVIDFYKGRYGSFEDIKRTALEDPVGFLADSSLFLTGAGAGVKVAGAAKIGRAATTAAQAIDPVSLAVRGVGGTAQKITKGRGIRPAIDPVAISAAERLEVPLTASAKTTSRATPLIESLVAKGLFGKKLDKMVNASKERLIAIADDVVKKADTSSDLSVAGNKIIEGMENFKKEFISTKNALYNDALKGDGLRQIKVRPDETINFLDNLISSEKEAALILGKSKDLRFFESLKKTLGKKQINASAYRNALQKLNNKISNFNDPFVSGNKGALKRIAATMSSELDDAIILNRPDLQNAINKANQFYADGISKLNSSYGKTILKFKDTPDKIVPALISKSTSIEDIPRIINVIGPENAPALRASFLETFFNKAKGADKTFSPSGISRQIKSIGENKLKVLLGDDQFKAIKDLEKLSESLGKAGKVISGSQTTFSMRVLAEAALLFSNPVAALKIIGGDALLSKFVTSKAGQRLLVEGFELQGGVGTAITRGAPAAEKAAKVLRLETVIKKQREESIKDSIRSRLSLQQQLRKKAA